MSIYNMFDIISMIAIFGLFGIEIMKVLRRSNCNCTASLRRSQELETPRPRV